MRAKSYHIAYNAMAALWLSSVLLNPLVRRVINVRAESALDRFEVGLVAIGSQLHAGCEAIGHVEHEGVGREGVKHAVREMTEPKSTIIKLAEPATRWQQLTGTSERNAS